jgi:signal transduction histidine kinase
MPAGHRPPKVLGMTIDPALTALRRTRAQQQAVQRWLRLGTPLLLVYWVWVSWHDTPGPGTSGRGLVILVAFAGFIAGSLGMRVTLGPSFGPVASGPMGPALVPAAPGGAGRELAEVVHWASLAMLLLSSAVLLWAQPGAAGIAGLVTCALLVSRRLPRRIGLALVGAAVAALAVVAVLAEGDAGPWGLIGVAGLGAFYGMALLAGQLGQANQQAERLLTELEHTRAAEARAAGLAERQRLAREMHDVLAHSLSGMMLQLEAARMLVAADPGDHRLPGAIERAQLLGNAGLTEASHAIGMLRDEELPGPERLPGLTSTFTENHGVPCELAVTGQVRPLPDEARLAVYRVAQEALTNVAKHAVPDRVRVGLAYEPGVIRLTVEDFTGALTGSAGGTGPGGSSAPGAGRPVRRPGRPGGGYGLTGMRERAELIGGDLTAAATTDGFRVELRVPA